MLYVENGWVYRRIRGRVVRMEELNEERMYHSLALVYSPGRAKTLASGLAILSAPLDDTQGVGVIWKGGDPDEKYGRVSLDNLEYALAIAYSVKG